MAAQPIGHEVYVMKRITLLGLAGIAFVSLSQPTWAGPRGGGGGQVGGAARRQPNRVGSTTGRNRVSDPRASTAANRQSFVRNHASERHDANNWHRDWDRHHSHFDHNRVFVFVDGFWWGLYPSDYDPYYAYGDYPDDYSGYYPYDSDYSSGNPYDYYNYSPYNDDDQSGYSNSG